MYTPICPFSYFFLSALCLCVVRGVKVDILVDAFGQVAYKHRRLDFMTYEDPGESMFLRTMGYSIKRKSNK